MALIDYLRGNRDLLEAFFLEQLPQFGISMSRRPTWRGSMLASWQAGGSDFL